ncbi:MAG: hypothetical protein HQK51_09075 [Oligoflexia bacterium]|nr:hypothetical protein [Oligoflexia bacterium]
MSINQHFKNSNNDFSDVNSNDNCDNNFATTNTLDPSPSPSPSPSPLKSTIKDMFVKKNTIEPKITNEFISSRNNSLMNKIFVYSSILSLCLMILLAAGFIKKNSNEIKANGDKKAKYLIDLLAQTTSIYLWNLDHEALNSLIAKGITDENLSYIAFFDQNGKIIVEKNNKTARDTIYSRDIFYGKTPVGKISIGLSSKEMETTVFKNIIAIILLILLVQVILSITLYVTVKRAMRPLYKQVSILDSMLFSTMTSVKDLNNASIDLRESALKQLEATEDWVKGTSEILHESNNNSKTTQTSIDIVNQIIEKATKGNDIMNEVSNSIDEIIRVGQKLQNISKLNTEVIVRKTEMINGIAFETKILSFNASIEAANAGEYGKGFAVVANELVKLAQMSGDAAGEISVTNQNSITEINEVIGQAMAAFDRGQDVINKAIGLFRNISETINEIHRNTNNMISNTQKNVISLKQMSDAISELKSLAQANSDAALRINHHSENIRDLNLNLCKFLSILNKTIFGRKVVSKIASQF